MTEKEILIARLTRFLKERGAYDKFITNLTNHEDIEALCDYEIRWVTPEESINDAFTWDTTIEGADYWHRLYIEFRDNYDNLSTEELESDPQWDKMWEE